MILAADGAKLFDLPPGGPIDQFRGPTTWAPDSQHLAVLAGEDLHILTADAQLVGSVRIPGGSGQWPVIAWSTDGSAFAVLTPAGASLELVIYDATTLEPIASAGMPATPPGTGDGMCLQWVRPVN
jgi:hypothetical protein